MNRRHFLAGLAAAVTGSAFDPERRLWVPGKKKIFLPPNDGWHPNSADIVGLTVEYWRQPNEVWGIVYRVGGQLIERKTCRGRDLPLMFFPQLSEVRFLQRTEELTRDEFLQRYPRPPGAAFLWDDARRKEPFQTASAESSRSAG